MSCFLSPIHLEKRVKQYLLSPLPLIIVYFIKDVLQRYLIQGVFVVILVNVPAHLFGRTFSII